VAGLAGKAKAGRGGNTSRKGRLNGAAGRRLDWVSTLASKGRGALRPEHLRFRPRPVGSKTLHLVLLDLSASMLRGEKLAWAKGCLLALTEQFYRDRDHMAVIGFAGEQARWLQSPAKAGAFNAGWIAPLRGGGGTPIQPAVDAVEGALRRCPPGTRATVWLLTDGRFDPLPVRPEGVDRCCIIDFENDAVALGRCQRLAAMWCGEWVRAELFATAG
jgi:magnesium chelatase subunit ChlD-like protein